jgi:hypothetical protein
MRWSESRGRGIAHLVLVRRMQRVPEKWRYSLIGLAAGLMIGVILLGPELLEPTDAPQYVRVQVVAYHTGARGRQWFTVTAPSGQSWQVGAARGPFTYDYRGPALLDARRGRWTGKLHLRLVQDTSSTNAPNQAKERTATGLVSKRRITTMPFMSSTLAPGRRPSSYFR